MVTVMVVRGEELMQMLAPDLHPEPPPMTKAGTDASRVGVRPRLGFQVQGRLTQMLRATGARSQA